MMMLTFVVRLWCETLAGGVRWRGQIEHVQSGRRRDFLEAQEMLGFLEGFGFGAGRLADLPVIPGEKTAGPAVSDKIKRQEGEDASSR